MSSHFDHNNMPFLFMRWKEQFLVPDHRVQNINGASFAGLWAGVASLITGFYYMCIDMTHHYPASPRRSHDALGRAELSGFYFHESSEPCVQAHQSLTHIRYQHLSLRHVPQQPSSSFELR